MADFSFISNAHPSVIESLYKDYLKDPESVDKEWKSFFAGFDYSVKFDGVSYNPDNQTSDSGNVTKEIGVSNLINAFRQRGHLLSTTNPIRNRKNRAPHLDLNDYDLSESDMGQSFKAGNAIGLNNATLAEIINHLKSIYCGHIGFEFAHIENWEKRNWLQDKIENRTHLDDFGINHESKIRILEKLNGAVMFEEFLHTKYVGQKRFSLEGGETTIAALDAMITIGANSGVEEVVIGMAHRGRLNVLANIMGKTYEQIFSEFEGTAVPDQSFGDGDVKYHLGFSSQVTTPDNKKVYLKLVPNPSHLEAVNPVVEGFARAKADIMYQSEYDKILPILIHGDAAVVGQGVVYEVVQMSQLNGYYTGGTMHFVINNQIGFTTDFEDGRSSTYCTASASLVQAPVFHVNGDDPEAVIFAVELATEYRQLFNNDVFIDMVCYRKHGHNEGDDPKFTQPQMYDIIAKHPNPREIYLKQLYSRGDISEAETDKLEKAYWSNLQSRLDEVKQKPLPYKYQEVEMAWKTLRKTTDPVDFKTSPETGVKKSIIEKLIQHLQTIPDGFKPLSKVNRLLKGKEAYVEAGQLDWAMAELAAYGSILMEGKDVRMSGQDVKRGTFSHRHAIFRDADTFAEYNRLTGLSNDQGRFMIYNSLLSEFAVLGFEYGYGLANPNSLVLWEAQFGDFSNGAQTIMDQFIVSAETKWQRMNGIVLLLPHGYEGQGPEHSSARLERFLCMGADFNITVANLTTPANFFHSLRRQLARPFRKPLIIMSPKSILRHPECISSIDEFATGSAFKEVYDETELGNIKADKVSKMVFCSGKIYYDLIAYRREQKIKDAVIVRIEQLYPYPEDQIDAIFTKYKKADIRWVQEEPANMGALNYIRNLFPNNAKMISRKPSASTATGFKKTHDRQQAEIMVKAFE
ncbi:MAG: 2-oxoglutarate dehydrogenase E1 component [Saprospiraceae bacterium]|nr:2-oxoglutarate dehydrogenase E1 component [Candidatus Brachybacter algidus]